MADLTSQESTAHVRDEGQHRASGGRAFAKRQLVYHDLYFSRRPPLATLEDRSHNALLHGSATSYLHGKPHGTYSSQSSYAAAFGFFVPYFDRLRILLGTPP
jgi:hypothetical protein